MVASILNYASEIWGFEEWSKLETLHLKACKYALGVRSSTTTDAVRGVNSILTLGRCQRLLPCKTGNCPAKNEVYSIT